MKKLIIAALFSAALCLTAHADMNPYVAGIVEESTPSGAALIFSDGFESPWLPVSNPGPWDSFGGTPTRETTVVAKGSVSMSTNAVEYMVVQHSSAQTEIWVDFWFRIDSGTATIHQIYRHNATGGAAYVYMSIKNTEELRVTDGTNNYDTGITLSADTWYHIFLHIALAAGGSETVQVASNTADTWDAWDYDNTSATLIPTDLLTFYYGRLSAPSSEIFYFDTASVYAGSGMPVGWQ